MAGESVSKKAATGKRRKLAPEAIEPLPDPVFPCRRTCLGYNRKLWMKA